MKKPILVTQLSNDSLEVLTDYQTILVSAHTSEGNHLTIYKEFNTSEGLLGISWIIEGELVEDTVSIVAKTRGTTDEYLFQLR